MNIPLKAESNKFAVCMMKSIATYHSKSQVIYLLINFKTFSDKKTSGL